MSSIKKIKHRIEAYKSTVSMLKQKIKRLEEQLNSDTFKDQESMEEGEIRKKTREKRKRKLEETKLEEPNFDAFIQEIEEKASKNISEALKDIFNSFNTLSKGDISKIFSKLSPHLTNTIKYVVLHDIILFSKDLDKYAEVYKIFYPDTIEKDGSEVSEVLEIVYYYSIEEEPIAGLKSRCISLHQKYAGNRVISGETIIPETFDAGTAIRLYTKVLDWHWTYNVFIIDTLFTDLRKDNSPFTVFVLSILYAEWSKSLPQHKSVEFVIQILDQIAGIGKAEEIVPSAYSIESQLTSALMLRQFRPGAAVKWHRIRVEQAAPEEKEFLEKAWKISFF